MDVKEIELSKEIPYDLRQVYAVEILGEHLKDVARARKKDDYSSYYKCLKDLWIIIQHKVKKKREASEQFNNLMTKAVKIINKYPNVFVGADKDPVGCSEIEQELSKAEMFLYDKIEEANMFGSNKRVPGL